MDIPAPKLQEIQDALMLAQQFVVALLEHERQFKEREAKIPKLEADIQDRVNRVVSLDTTARELEVRVSALRAERQQEEATVAELLKVRGSEESRLNKIRHELSVLQQKFAGS